MEIIPKALCFFYWSSTDKLQTGLRSTGCSVYNVTYLGHFLGEKKSELVIFECDVSHNLGNTQQVS